MRPNRLPIRLAVAALAVAAAACGSSPAEPSAPKAIVMVPDLVGLPFETAFLEGVSSFRLVPAASCLVPGRPIVLTQSPRAGTWAREGTDLRVECQ